MNLIRQLLLTTFPGLKMVWFLLLPWMGYLAALMTAPDTKPLMSTILIGWVILFVYQPVRIGMVLAEPLNRFREGKKPESGFAKTLLASSASFLPAGMIGLNQILLDGNWRSYFLEQFTIEVGTLVLATAGVILFGKNKEGRTAWQDLGIIPLFFTALVIGAIWGIVDTWWQIQNYAKAPVHTLGILGIAIGAALIHEYRTMTRVARGEIELSEATGGGKWEMALIFGQLILWVALPAVRLL